ncbi:phage major capsid protein [bacterium]|nr:MAG: phage major capsid protein [bacterium]
MPPRPGAPRCERSPSSLSTFPTSCRPDERKQPMNPKKRALLKQLAEKKAAVDAIIAKGETATDEEYAQAQTLATECKGIQSQIQGIDTMDAALKDVGDFLTAPANGIQQPVVKRTRTGVQAGEDIVEIMLNGARRTVDHTNLGITEKAWDRMREDDYGTAFRMYLRKGDNLGRTHRDVLEEVKAYSEGIDEDGGYFVPPTMLNEIVKRDARTPSLLNDVRTVPTNSDSLKMPKIVYGANDGDVYSNPMRKKRTGETDPPAGENQAKLGTITIPVFEGTVEVPITRTLLEDSGFDIQNWVEEMFRESFALDTENELLFGDGITQPRGMLMDTGTANGIPEFNLGNPVTADNLIKFNYSLPVQYRGGAKFYCEDQSVFATWATIKDGSGAYIFGVQSTTDGGLARPRGETFLGKPIGFSPFMPQSGGGNKVALYGDLRRAYYYALRLGITMRMQDLPRDPFVYSVFRYRDGGQLVMPRAARVGVQS